MPISMHSANRPLNSIAVPPQARAGYCFFLLKGALYPNSGSRMSEERLDSYIRQLLEAQETPEVTVAWQGGEPTQMRIDFFRRAV